MYRQVFDIVEKREMTLGQVTYIGDPLALFRIDIQMIIVRPAHVASQIIIEEPLQCYG